MRKGQKDKRQRTKDKGQKQAKRMKIGEHTNDEKMGSENRTKRMFTKENDKDTWVRTDIPVTRATLPGVDLAADFGDAREVIINLFPGFCGSHLLSSIFSPRRIPNSKWCNPNIFFRCCFLFEH